LPKLEQNQDLTIILWKCLQNNKEAIHLISPLNKDNENIKVQNQAALSSYSSEKRPLFIDFG
jgi:superfamily I DNA and RNA helicase